MRKNGLGVLLAGVVLVGVCVFTLFGETKYDVFDENGNKIDTITQSEYDAMYNPNKSSQSSTYNVASSTSKVDSAINKIDNMDDEKKEKLKNKAEKIYNNLNEDEKEKLRGVYDGLSDDTKSKVKSFLGR